MRVWIVAALPVMAGITFTGGVQPAACDPVLSSDRPADTYVREDVKHDRPRAVAETYFFPLPMTCPRTPAGYVRWDLCR